jgi:hypothetical protein
MLVGDIGDRGCKWESRKEARGSPSMEFDDLSRRFAIYVVNVLPGAVHRVVDMVDRDVSLL